MPSLKDYLTGGDFDKAEAGFPRYDDGVYEFNVQEEPTIVTDKGKPFMQLAAVCVKGPAQKDSSDPAGRPMRDRLYLTPASLWRVKTLLIAGGRLSRDDKESDMAKGRFGPDAFIGITFKCKISTREGQDDNGVPTGKFYNDFEYLAD